jgi:predicted kinase
MAKATPVKPLLIMMYGFPGSGKSYFARQMTDFMQIAHIQGDRIRGELFSEPRYDKQENAIVSQLMNYMTEEFLSSGVSVIYDDSTYRLSQRMALREMARKKGAVPLLIWLQIDADSSYVRLDKRDRRRSEDKYSRDYTEESYAKMLGTLQNPSNEDFIVLSGKHTFASQRSAVFKRLSELGLISIITTQQNVVKPGLMNRVPGSSGRVDLTRRNINIH